MAFRPRCYQKKKKDQNAIREKVDTLYTTFLPYIE